ncbi:Thiamine-phosphate synthase [Vibrio ruber DSM 16370]|uniref:Thiamine-phosphate synthase n=1 Tax=Vibrio ruber (strain DSM 16370 / JCM 11486 / BCRC 17186 / CECT 7878 / LMG 23124 / VR1) TaxID=1123498 RepID=A0A1R4LR10_VIBR1|nr:thiamine phosphate synthase [Vibrio ruber]SJN58918.1 Thiamine-phosphate synthase [Vibrio ruber DSM 16370]
MIGLSVSKDFLTADMLALVKSELHHVLYIAQAEGLTAPKMHFLFDDSGDYHLCIELERSDPIDPEVSVDVSSTEKNCVILMADEQSQQAVQQNYQIIYCAQVSDKPIASEQQIVSKAEMLSKIKAKGRDVAIAVAYSPQQDAPHTELWLAGDEVRSLSLSSTAFSSTLASEISDDGFPHLLVTKHLAWLMGALLLDFPLEDALIIARASMNVSRETWPQHIHEFPAISSAVVATTKDESDTENESVEKSFFSVQSVSEGNACRQVFKAVDMEDLSLYPVVDDVQWVDQLLQLGVKTIQLRIKNPHQPDLEQQIKQAILLGQTYQAQVFINDYWQLAIKHQAFGVHLGQEDLHTADIQALHRAGICLGISTHGYWEILKAHQLHPSYIALGHIFPTTTKQMPSQPQGLVRLRLYQRLVDSIAQAQHRVIPTVAIGGIALDNAAAVLEQGVSSVAVVRAVTQAANTARAVEDFRQLFLSRKVQVQSRRKHDVITQ